MAEIDQAIGDVSVADGDGEGGGDVSPALSVGLSLVYVDRAGEYILFFRLSREKCDVRNTRTRNRTSKQTVATTILVLVSWLFLLLPRMLRPDRFRAQGASEQPVGPGPPQPCACVVSRLFFSRHL